MATYTVTTLSDSGDDLTVTGNLASETADGSGLSLREAVNLANANAGSDTVAFDETLAGGTIKLTNGALFISDTTTIDGQIDADDDPDITIDAWAIHVSSRSAPRRMVQCFRA